MTPRDVMLALVASIHVLNTAFDHRRRGWSGQARPWRRRLPCKPLRPPFRRQKPPPEPITAPRRSFAGADKSRMRRGWAPGGRLPAEIKGW